MKIKSITPVGKRKVYDISVEDVEHYILDNGVASHNTGIYYSADNIFIIGRQQEKDGNELTGYNFIINVEKSRYVREKSKIPVEVSFEGGISKWSGLLDIALEGGFVTKPSNGWYAKAGEQNKYRLKDTHNKEFWMPIIQSKEFNTFVENRYRMSNNSMMSTMNASAAEISEEYNNAE
jgi:hypothetical protein